MCISTSKVLDSNSIKVMLSICLLLTDLSPNEKCMTNFIINVEYPGAQFEQTSKIRDGLSGIDGYFTFMIKLYT